MDARRDQSGVIARAQLLNAGLSDHDIRRMVRRRELTTIHRGVYVDHTGEPAWMQRAWAAVLFAWPAALCGASALRAHHPESASRHDHRTIHVAVDRGRTVVSPQGVVVHCRSRLADRVAWNLSPPRLRYEEAVIDVAEHRRRRLDAVATLADAVGARRTTAARLKAVITSRERVRDRAWLLGVLEDIATGTWSVLEHGYLDLIERPHGLPTGLRQVRHVGASGTQYRDVELPGLAIIELDGRGHHSTTHQRDADLDRDLDAAALTRTTLRLGYGQVFDRPCHTAIKVGTVLNRLGWTDTVRPCRPACMAA